MESGNTRMDRNTYKRLPKYLRRKTPGDIIFEICNAAFLVLFSLTILYPFWMTLLLSFSKVDEVTSLGFNIWIKEWSLDAYKFSLSSQYGNVPNAYINSIFRTVVGTAITVIFSLLAAFPLSKKNLPGRNFLTLAILFTMFFSGGLIPTYLLIRSIGLLNTRWALILPSAAVAYYIIIMRNFLMTVDSAYEESAFMDGANYFQILTRIIIPLSKPVIATIALWTAVGHWNAWFDALIYINDESKIVLQLLLRRLIAQLQRLGEQMADYSAHEDVDLPTESVKAAITVLTIGPIILLYPFLQKHFIKGIFLGSLKG